MTRRITLAALFGLLIAFPGTAAAQELLTNGGLELVFPDLGGRDSAPPGWTLVEGPMVPEMPPPYPGDYSENDSVDAADYTVWRDRLGETVTLPNESPIITPGLVTIDDYDFWKLEFGEPDPMSLAEPGNFGHLIFEGDWHMWFQPYYGTFAEAEQNFAQLTQVVAGTPGLSYTLEGWALFEAHYAGGRNNLNQPGTSVFPPDDGAPSPTDSYFALEFLDSSGEVLPGSVELELMADGQQNDTLWMKHTLNAVAPAGTVDVRVRVSMIDGVLNPNADPQSFFVDALSLTATSGVGAVNVVPEPAVFVFAGVGVAVLSAIRLNARRRKS